MDLKCCFVQPVPGVQMVAHERKYTKIYENIHETEKKNSKITSTNRLVGSLAKLGDLSRIGKTERADYRSHGRIHQRSASELIRMSYGTSNSQPVSPKQIRVETFAFLEMKKGNIIWAQE